MLIFLNPDWGYVLQLYILLQIFLVSFNVKNYREGWLDSIFGETWGRKEINVNFIVED